jgi:hypothetical protein
MSLFSPATATIKNVTRRFSLLLWTENHAKKNVRPTHVVLIISGMYIPYREWIQKEIDIAEELGDLYTYQ